MTYTRVMALGAMLACIGALGVQAQSASDAIAPAELPPSSFDGKEYVDSQGCVFIRAGIDGNVTWVPRVTRDRQQVCGQEPSLVASTDTETTPARVAPPAQVAPDPEPVEAVENAQATSAPAPRPTVATTVEPTQEPATEQPPAELQTQAEDTPQSGSAPAAPALAETSVEEVPVIVSAPATTPSPAPRRSAPAPAVAAITRPAEPTVTPGQRRFLPAHLLDERRSASVVTVPEGYEPVWRDGRLNPQRAEQSFDGHRATQFQWTNTVPRRAFSGSSRASRIREPKAAADPADAQVYRPVIVQPQAAKSTIGNALADASR